MSMPFEAAAEDESMSTIVHSQTQVNFFSAEK